MPTLDRITRADGLAPGTGYAHAVVVSGRLAFVSGQISVDSSGAVVAPGDVGAQARQALVNLRKVLEALEAGWADVVKLTWYLVDVTEIQAVRDARDTVFRPALGELPNPASTLVEVAGLFRQEFLVEVDAVVALPS